MSTSFPFVIVGAGPGGASRTGSAPPTISSCALHSGPLDRPARQLELASGERISYQRLLLATGAAPRRLRLLGADLDAVHYLRSHRDVDHDGPGASGELTADAWASTCPTRLPSTAEAYRP